MCYQNFGQGVYIRPCTECVPNRVLVCVSGLVLGVYQTLYRMCTDPCVILVLVCISGLVQGVVSDLVQGMFLVQGVYQT